MDGATLDFILALAALFAYGAAASYALGKILSFSEFCYRDWIGKMAEQSADNDK